MLWIKWLGIVVGSFAVPVIALATYGAMRWADATRALHFRLEAARMAPAPVCYDSRELDGLPAPAQRFFRAVLTDGQPMIAAATVLHTGTFNMGESAGQWKAFTSTQRVITRQPGFVWDGRVAVLPGLNVHVHDAYVAGEGILHPTILGVFTLVEMRGTGDVASGELMRWLAETAWYPTALLPSQGVRWEPVDERSARATLKDGPHVLTMTFTFGDDGLLRSGRAEARGRIVGKEIVMSPWEGRWSNYQVHDGMRVPMSGEVAWLLPEGRKPYWRGTISSLRYEFAR